MSCEAGYNLPIISLATRVSRPKMSFNLFTRANAIPDSPAAARADEAEDRGDLTAQMTALNMSILPGLQLNTPSEPVSAPIIHEIKENTEWRFEVAFGSKIEVKVCPARFFDCKVMGTTTDDVVLAPP